MRTLILFLAVSVSFCSFTSFDGGPRASLAGTYSGAIDKEAIFKKPVLKADGMEVVSFVLSVVLNEKSVVQKTAEGSKLTDDMLALVRKAESGQKLYFEKITVKNRAGDEVKMGNLILVLE